MSERIISADSHVAVSHDQIKANLDPKFHAAYDDAVRAFGERMARGAGAANAAGAAMKAAEKKEALAELNQALKEVQPIKNQGNIALVEKNYDQLAKLMQE